MFGKLSVRQLSSVRTWRWSRPQLQEQGSQSSADVRHRHHQVCQARQGLHLQLDQEGGGQHQD